MGLKRAIYYNGKNYESIAQFMRLNGLEHKDIRAVKESFNFEYVPIFKAGHKEFYSLQEISEFYGIKLNTLRNAYFRVGLSIQEIIRRHKKGLVMRLNPIKDHLGNEYNTKSEMCQKYGISLNQFIRRIKLGYTLEQALTTKKYVHVK